MTVDTETSTAQDPQGEVQETPEQPQGEAPASEPSDQPEAPDTNPEKPEIDWKAMSRKHEDRSKALAAENADLKKQLETATSAAEKRAERAELAAEVATSKGVKLRYLSGETREELEAAADAWIEDAKAINSRVGVVPTQGTGDPAPRTSSYASGVERARAQFEKTK